MTSSLYASSLLHPSPFYGSSGGATAGGARLHSPPRPPLATWSAPPLPATYTSLVHPAPPISPPLPHPVASSVRSTTQPPAASPNTAQLSVNLDEVLQQIRLRDKENDELRTRLRQVFDDLVAANNAAKENSGEHDKLTEQVALLSQQVATLTAQNEQLAGINSGIDVKIAETTKQFTVQSESFHAQIRQQSSEIVQLTAKLSERDTEIISLQRQLHSATVTASHKQEAFRRDVEVESDNRIRLLQKQLQQSHDDQRALLADKDAKITSLASTLSRVQDTAQLDNQRFADVRKETLSKDAEIVRLSAELEESRRQKMFEVEQVHAELQAEQRNKDELIRQNQLHVLTLQKEIDARTTEIETLQHRLNSTKHSTDADLRRREEAIAEDKRAILERERASNEKLRHAERQVTELQDALDRAKRQMRDEATGRDAADNEKNHAEERALQLQRVIGKRDLEIQRLQGQVALLLKEVGDAEKTADVVKAEFDLRDRIEVSKQEMELSRRLTRYHQSAIFPEAALQELATAATTATAVQQPSFYAPAAGDLPRPAEPTWLPSPIPRQRGGQPGGLNVSQYAPNVSVAGGTPVRRPPLFGGSEYSHLAAATGTSMSAGGNTTTVLPVAVGSSAPAAGGDGSAVMALRESLALAQQQVSHLHEAKERELERQLAEARRHAEKVKRRSEQSLMMMQQQLQESQHIQAATAAASVPRQHDVSVSPASDARATSAQQPLSSSAAAWDRMQEYRRQLSAARATTLAANPILEAAREQLGRSGAPSSAASSTGATTASTRRP